MALLDYRVCDVCGEKAFYDAKLNYRRVIGHELKIAGEYTDDPLLSLDNLGDWAILCRACAKTHRTKIEKIISDENPEGWPPLLPRGPK